MSIITEVTEHFRIKKVNCKTFGMGKCCVKDGILGLLE